MRLTLTTFLTLDGVVQGPGSPDEDRTDGFDLGGWVPPHFDEAVGERITGIFEQADAFLLGRRTYDIFAAWWPNVTDPADPVGGRLNNLPKYVATGRDDELTWSGSERLDGDLVKAVTALKEQPGRELQVHGSGRLAQSLMREGLIDAYHLMIFPVVLGRGRRLFADGLPPTGLRLADSRASGSGVTMLTYENAGAAAFGSVEG
ncbi:dihydrofolate reductase family protein [Micromonospora sp. R77]|uniref:dihydrofolate reductase family protein n=1 Tax=Micromonospora sp. R77 TaxID=2925836 RepID=UPI001F60684D|nr:dihydrofolate reductase family protein [Micromonospora sp. R77]MCI4064150.1 dihydrofolate reductase family protein [Micromonospora sp. R77]